MILALVLLIGNFANAKPLTKQNLDLDSENSLQFEKLIKRIEILEELTSKLIFACQCIHDRSRNCFPTNSLEFL